MKLTLYDEDWLTNDLVGEVLVHISNLTYSVPHKQWIQVYYKGNKAAEVYI